MYAVILQIMPNCPSNCIKEVCVVMVTVILDVF
jgi:hypothetical protein